MNKSKGNPNTKIWLIGDSAPEKWEKDLTHPFDERHPVIHNIWTPIIYKIQKLIYDEKSILISDDFFIRNAVEKACTKPKNNIKE
ncbi:hypothetical protein EZS27_027322 [termite gut metagenome]|uniref:Uncharacterized protein n=1 Tax=termite gut metagenome TaxID=433724 RepID=A0A5J4QQ53_9ZZZZ